MSPEARDALDHGEALALSTLDPTPGRSMAPHQRPGVAP